MHFVNDIVWLAFQSVRVPTGPDPSPSSYVGIPKVLFADSILLQTLSSLVGLRRQASGYLLITPPGMEAVLCTSEHGGSAQVSSSNNTKPVRQYILSCKLFSPLGLKSSCFTCIMAVARLSLQAGRTHYLEEW